MNPAGRSGSVAHDPAQLLGEILGSHRLIRLLGKGGMGAVYEAEHIKIGRRDAVKVLFPELAQLEYAVRFLREAQAVNRVRHPSLVEIHHFDQTPDGLLYIVMELLQGTTVESRLASKPSGLGREAACRIGVQVASAMAAIHAVGIIHRDLTPRNIMLVKPAPGGDEQVKVLDFGIAKVPARSLDSPQSGADLTDRRTIVGSRDYMPPEQFADLSTVTDRGDVFALGVILCELIGGKRPFPGYSLALLSSDPPAPALPGDATPRLRALLARMLTRDPAQRPAMSEVGAVLAQEVPKPRRLRLAALGLLGAVCMGGAAGLWLIPPRRAQQSAELSVAALRADAQALLTTAAADSDARIRTQAALAIGHSRYPALGDALLKLLSDPSVETRLEAIQACATWQYAPAREPLRAAAQAGTLDMVRVAATSALAELGDEEARQHLVQLAAQVPERLKLPANQRGCEAGDAAACRRLAALVADPAVRLPPAVALPVYKTLAVARQPSARAWLQQQAEQTDPPGLQTFALAALARLSADQAAVTSARQTLDRLAKEGDFPAAVEAARLRSRAGQDTLLRWLEDPDKKLDSRVLAARALGELVGGIERSLRALAGLLQKPSPELRPLQIAAAGSVLRLLLSERDLDGWQLALAGGSVTTSGLMAWLDDERGLQQGAEVEIFRNLSDPERRLLTLLAGRKRISYALGILRAALDDANSDVQVEGVRALSSILAALPRTGGAQSPSLARQLARMEGGNPVDQVVAAAVRLRLGDATSREKLQRLFAQATDVRVRELIVELIPGEPQSALLRGALRDPALSVRFLAARALAEAGSSAGQAVFEELLRRGDGYALAGYGWLKRLGMKPAALDWMRLLGAEQDLLVRYQALEAIVELSVEEALPLLRFALADPAVVVRSRAAEVAARIYRRTRVSELLGIIRALLTDEDAILRARALQFLRDLRADGLITEPGERPTASGSQHRSDDLWRPRSVQPASETAKNPPVAPTPVASKPTPPAPPSAPTKPPSPAASPALPLGRAARAAEGRGDFLQAVKQWEAVLRLPASQRTPAQEAEAMQALARIRKELGSFRLYHLVDGKCVPESSIRWGKAGDNVIAEYKLRVFLSKGQYKEVRTLCSQK